LNWRPLVTSFLGVTIYWNESFAPFPTDRSLVVPNVFCEGSPNIGKGKKTPFPTNPKRQKINFGKSWRRGLFPPPLMVMSNKVRHLLRSIERVKSPFRTYPRKTKISFWGRVGGRLCLPPIFLTFFLVWHAICCWCNSFTYNTNKRTYCKNVWKRKVKSNRNLSCNTFCNRLEQEL